MSNAIVALIVAALLLAAVALVAQASFKSMDDLSDAWKQMEVRSGDISRTEIRVKETSGTLFVDVVLDNLGETSLRDFDMWDVIVQYYQASGTYHQRWLTYTATAPPANNQWTVIGVYRDAEAATAEVYQPDIFDPGEELLIRLKLSPAASGSTTHRVIIATPVGVTAIGTF